MKYKSSPFLLLLLSAFSPLFAQDAQPQAISWYATLESGFAEARRTQLPILLVSAAPHCRQISGIW